MSEERQLELDTLSPSSLYGTWKGIEHFRAETKDEIGKVPYSLYEDLTGEVELTIVLDEDLCTISKFGEPIKDCVYHHQRKLIAVSDGMYGAHYESGYRIVGFTDNKISLKSTLKNWLKTDDYSYTHFEFANAFLNKVKGKVLKE
jgi:hypothetical protein